MAELAFLPSGQTPGCVGLKSEGLQERPELLASFRPESLTLGLKLGFESRIMTLTSSCEKPPCSACFLSASRIRNSDVRSDEDVWRPGICIRGRPGALNSCRMCREDLRACPRDIGRGRRLLLESGLTASSAVQLLFNQIIETISGRSMTVGLDGDSELGMSSRCCPKWWLR